MNTISKQPRQRKLAKKTIAKKNLTNVYIDGKKCLKCWTNKLKHNKQCKKFVIKNNTDFSIKENNEEFNEDGTKKFVETVYNVKKNSTIKNEKYNRIVKNVNTNRKRYHNAV